MYSRGSNIVAKQSHFAVHENSMYNKQNPSFPSSTSNFYSNQTPIPWLLSIPSPVASLVTDCGSSYVDLFPES